MRSLLGRFHRPMSRGLVNNMLTMNNLGDGSTLSLDFTTMGGVLDPRLTFSRASTATFVNSSGYVENAGANTAPYSESLNVGLGYSDNAILSRSTTTSPTGNTAVVFYPTIVLDYHRLQIGLTVAMVGATTISVYVKQIGSDYRAGINAVTYIGASVIFSLVGNGSVVGAVGGTAPNRAATITKVTDDGWYRITLTGTFNTISSVYVFMASSTSTDSTGQNFVGVASQGIAIWGLQVNPGSTAQTYYPTTTAAYHAPRFDYSPTNIGEPRGLLIEGQTINLAYRSNDFALTPTDGNNWNSSGYTADFTSTSLPDGSTGNARRLSMASGAGSYRSNSLTVTASTQYTFSFWARNNGGSQARYRVWNITAGSSIVDYNLSGSNYVASIGGANNTSSTWVRISVTFTTPAGCTSIYIYPSSSDSGTVDLLVWGAQLELGSGASSYIPTGASQVTRTADLCSMTGSNFTNVFGDGSLGTITCSHEFSRANHGVAHQPTPFAIGSYTATNARGYSYGSYTLGVTSNYGWVYTSAAFSSAATSVAFAAKNKCAIAYNGLAVTAALNGTTNSATGSGTITVSSAIGLQIGYNTTPRDFINACVSNIKFYPTALTAAQLQALTTP